jgi:hypothetical protein
MMPCSAVAVLPRLWSALLQRLGVSLEKTESFRDERIGRHIWHRAEMTSRIPSKRLALQIVLDQVLSTAYTLH